MKKSIFVFALLIVCFLGLSACGNDNSHEGEVHEGILVDADLMEKHRTEIEDCVARLANESEMHTIRQGKEYYYSEITVLVASEKDNMCILQADFMYRNKKHIEFYFYKDGEYVDESDSVDDASKLNLSEYEEKWYNPIEEDETEVEEKAEYSEPNTVEDEKQEVNLPTDFVNQICGEYQSVDGNSLKIKKIDSTMELIIDSFSYGVIESMIDEITFKGICDSGEVFEMQYMDGNVYIYGRIDDYVFYSKDNLPQDDKEENSYSDDTVKNTEEDLIDITGQFYSEGSYFNDYKKENLTITKDGEGNYLLSTDEGYFGYLQSVGENRFEGRDASSNYLEGNYNTYDDILFLETDEDSYTFYRK